MTLIKIERTAANSGESRANQEPAIDIVTSAPPPLLIVALVGLFVAVFVTFFPSLENIDEYATVETFTNRVFPSLLSLKALAWIRLDIAAFCLFVSYRGSFIDPGWEQATTYLPQSKLKRGVYIQMRGYRTQLPFTSWAWNLLGLSFLLNGVIALMVAYDKRDIPWPWLLRLALLSFETAAPTTLLVACVVRYAIWPRVLQAGGDTAQLFSFQALVMHNLNVMFALTEVGLLGGLPVVFSHWTVAPLFGIVYILFTWFMISRWLPSGEAQFIYFFFDTTLGIKFMAIALLSLLFILLLFYGLFGAFDQVLTHLNGGPIVHCMAIVLVSSVVCRFRD
jgi:hypothetical protein